MNNSVLVRIWTEMADCFQLAMTTLEVSILTGEVELLPAAQAAVMDGWNVFAEAFAADVKQAAVAEA